MASEARYRLLADDYELTSVARVPYRRIGLSVLALPLSAFVFCVVYSILFNFEHSTSTHCGAYNVLPSISASIGSYSPQKEVWKLAIILHAIPRLLMVYFDFYYNREVLFEITKIPSIIDTLLHIIENVALVSLTLYDSSNYYSTHEKSFMIFILTSELHMLLIVAMHQRCRRVVRNKSEINSFWWKKFMVCINVLAVIFSGYFYVLHNVRCPNYAYTMFAICEYIVVFSNMIFHITSTLDFADRDLVFYRYGITMTHRPFD